MRESIWRTVLDLAVFAVLFPMAIRLVPYHSSNGDYEGLQYVFLALVGGPMFSGLWILLHRSEWVERLANPGLREELYLAGVLADAYLAARLRTTRRSILLCHGLPILLTATVLWDFQSSWHESYIRWWVSWHWARQISGAALVQLALADRIERLCRPLPAGQSRGAGPLFALGGFAFLMIVGPPILLSLQIQFLEEESAGSAWARWPARVFEVVPYVVAIALVVAARARMRACARGYYRFEPEP